MKWYEYEWVSLLSIWFLFSRSHNPIPQEYRFFPDTWILPTDMSDFKQQLLGGRAVVGLFSMLLSRRGFPYGL